MNKNPKKNIISSGQENIGDIPDILRTDILHVLDRHHILEKDIQSNFAYIDDKLSLFSNLKENFDTIPHLKTLLSLYMIIYRKCNDHDRDILKKMIKKHLISAGVYNNQQILEFCLLISERKRSFVDCPSHVSDEDLGKYYFKKYKNNEKRASKDFRFYLKKTHSYQTDNNRKIEEVILYMISQSRGNLAGVIPSPDPGIITTINDAETYFQNSFLSLFKKNAPLSLRSVTRITDELTEHADRISGHTFINQGNFYRNRDEFVHLVIHEGMHLCFDGFDTTMIEEGLIEYYIQKMYFQYPSDKFSYRPISATYAEWKNYFSMIFKSFPKLEDCFTKYFLTGDMSDLKKYIAVHLSDEAIHKIENEQYLRGLSDFLQSLKKLAEV